MSKEFIINVGKSEYEFKGPLAAYATLCVSAGTVGAVGGAVIGSVLASAMVAASPFLVGRVAYKYGKIVLHRAAGGTM